MSEENFSDLFQPTSSHFSSKSLVCSKSFPASVMKFMCLLLLISSVSTTHVASPIPPAVAPSTITLPPEEPQIEKREDYALDQLPLGNPRETLRTSESSGYGSRTSAYSQPVAPPPPPPAYTPQPVAVQEVPQSYPPQQQQNYAQKPQDNYQPQQPYTPAPQTYPQQQYPSQQQNYPQKQQENYQSSQPYQPPATQQYPPQQQQNYSPKPQENYQPPQQQASQQQPNQYSQGNNNQGLSYDVADNNNDDLLDDDEDGEYVVSSTPTSLTQQYGQGYSDALLEGDYASGYHLTPSNSVPSYPTYPKAQTVRMNENKITENLFLFPVIHF